MFGECMSTLFQSGTVCSDVFIFNYFGVFSISFLVTVCGKRRVTTRKTNTLSTTQKSNKVQVKPKLETASEADKKPAQRKKVVGCQPTREDEGIETQTESRTRTDSDEKLKTENSIRSQKTVYSSKKSTQETSEVLKVRPKIPTRGTEAKKMRISDETSAKNTEQLSGSESTEEANDKSLNLSKKTDKSSKDDDKSFTLESIQTDEDELIKN